MGTSYQGYKDLNVFQNSYSLAIRIFDLSNQFPVEERYSLTNQIRRSSRSVSINISEAWAFRRYPKSFVNKFWRQKLGLNLQKIIII